MFHAAMLPLPACQLAKGHAMACKLEMEVGYLSFPCRFLSPSLPHAYTSASTNGLEWGADRSSIYELLRVSVSIPSCFQTVISEPKT